MSQFLVDAATGEKLLGIDQSVELVDPTGRSLGWFQPRQTWTLDDIEIPEVSREEFQRRVDEAKNGKCFTSKEVLAHLESLE